jgi:hypothetical protein
MQAIIHQPSREKVFSMPFISMSLTVVHSFDAEDVDLNDEAAVMKACQEEAGELASRTGLSVDPESIEVD